MRITIRKWFWVWDFDKEEKWLNEMTAKGLVLVAVGFCKYTFEECTPGEYQVRLELLENLPTHSESQQYIKFIEETGAECLGSVMRWVYFRGKANNSDFNLYSDNTSRVKHLNRISVLIGICGFINILNGLNNIGLYFSSGLTANLIIGILCLGLASFISYGFIKIFIKKRKLQKQQYLFE